MATEYNQGIDDKERYTRMGVGIAHGFGTLVLTAFGAGQAAPVLGGLEETILDASFSSQQQKAERINPGANVRAAAAGKPIQYEGSPVQVMTTGNQTPPVTIQDGPDNSARIRMMYGYNPG